MPCFWLGALARITPTSWTSLALGRALGLRNYVKKLRIPG